MTGIITTAVTHHWVARSTASTLIMVENMPSALAHIVASDFEFALGDGLVSVDGAVVVDEAGVVSRNGVSDGAVVVGWVVDPGRVVVIGRIVVVDGLVVADGLTVPCGLGVSEYIDAIRLHEVRKIMSKLKSPS